MPFKTRAAAAVVSVIMITIALPAVVVVRLAALRDRAVDKLRGML